MSNASKATDATVSSAVEHESWIWIRRASWALIALLLAAVVGILIDDRNDVRALRVKVSKQEVRLRVLEQHVDRMVDLLLKQKRRSSSGAGEG